jgi:hypothetical protein
MNYSEIVDAVLSYSDRQDDEVINKVDLFLRVVESRINRKLETLKMETRARLPMSEDIEYYPVPSSFLAIRSIRIVSDIDTLIRRTLSYVNPEQFGNLITNQAEGDYYTIIANNFHIRSDYSADFQIEIEYIKQITPLTEAASTNWIADNHPDCYIFGALVEVNAFVKDAEATNIWDVRFKECLEEINFQDNIATWSGTALQTRVG